MKKKIVIILSALLIVACLLTFVACSRGENPPKDNNVSRQTDGYFAGENAQFAVSVEKGKREKNFIADGKSEEVQDFVQIEIVPLQKNEYEKINYILSGDGATFSGELAPSSNGEWTSAIEIAFVPTSVTVTAGEDSCDIQLVNVLDGCLSSADVLNIAKDAFKERLDKEKADGKGEREVYVKLISGDRKTYYYYVSFIGEGVDYWAMLVDTKSGEIVTQK